MPKSKNNILEKIWEMTQANSKCLIDIKSHVAVLNQEMGDVKTEIEHIKNHYTSQAEFKPVQKIVYGIVGAVLLAVMGAVLGLVILK